MKVRVKRKNRLNLKVSATVYWQIDSVEKLKNYLFNLAKLGFQKLKVQSSLLILKRDLFHCQFFIEKLLLNINFLNTIL